MAKRDTLFTVVGITTHVGVDDNGETDVRTKVRFGTDLIRVVKMLSTSNKVGNRTLGICLEPKRVDFVNLPHGMLKDDALKFMLTMPEFQSADDQLLIQETIEHRQPRVSKRVRGSRVKKDASVTIDSIQSRERNVTPEQIIATVFDKT